MAIVIFEIMRRRPIRLGAAWVAPALAACSIFAWIALFGGLVSPAAAARKSVSTAKLLRLFPDHGLYFLACVGLYFVAYEAVLFRHNPIRRRWLWRRNLSIAIVLAALFALFPPLRNVDFSVQTMGFLDRAARIVFNDLLRMVLFYVLALIACLRFNRFSMSTLFVFCNALIMIKS